MLGYEAIGRLAVGELTTANAVAVTASSGTLTLTFQSVASQISVAADAGTLTLTFQTVNTAVSMPAGQGTFNLTGQAAALTSAFILPASPFLYTERSQFGFAALGQVALGEYQSSQRPTLQIAFQTVQSNFSMPAAQGTFSLSGQPAFLFLGNILSAASGSYTLTGSQAVFQINMPADRGTFTTTFQVYDNVITLPTKMRAFARVGRSTISARSVGRDIRAKVYGG
jgi:hypothetical protein